jgi:hypothetical protein
VTEPPTVVLRTSPLNVLAAISLTVCATPFAFAAPWLWLVYLVPLLMILRVLRLRTTAGPEGLVTRGALRSARVPWADVSALRLRSSRTRSRVSAVLGDGSERPLPAVHVRDLPILAVVSGGRLPDPTAPQPAPAHPAVPSDVSASHEDHAEPASPEE